MQTTPFCNIDCKYCYLPDRRNTKRMEPSVVQRLAQRVAAYQDDSDKVRWYWHAGEPLSVGLDHFQRCHDAVAAGAPDLAATFEYHVQTNGTLLDAAWAQFFKQHRYGIGVSLDGPRAIHDANRVTRGGVGTFDKVVAGIKLLQDAGLKPGVLAVVTANSIDHPLELLDTFGALGVDSVAFNFEEIEGTNTMSSLRALDQAGDLSGKVQQFIETILQQRQARYPGMRLRETDWMLPSILSGDAVEGWLTRPMTYLTVLADGRASTFCPELAGMASRDIERTGFPICQIDDEAFDSYLGRVFASDAYAAIRDGVDRCRVTCDYFSLCGGGTPSNKFFEAGRFDCTETLHCRIHNQYAVEAVLDHIIASDTATASMVAL